MPTMIANTKREKGRISAQFRRFRRVHLLRQIDLAELMGVTERTIRNIEKSDHGASTMVLLKFADAKRAIRGGLKKSRSDLKRVPR